MKYLFAILTFYFRPLIQTLYFANDTGDKLVKTSRSVVYNTNIPIEKLVVDELIKGITSADDGYPVLNPTAKSVSVTVNDGTCYVNMDPSYLSPAYPVTDDVITYSITDSLVELGGINKVQISVDDPEPGISRGDSPLTGLFERGGAIPLFFRAKTRSLQISRNVIKSNHKRGDPQKKEKYKI